MTSSKETIPNVVQLKSQAQRLRHFLADKDIEISQASSLEALAKQYGYRDWNVLSALAKRQSSENNWPEIGETVAGTYLGQDFTGKIIRQNVTDLPGAKAYTIRLEQPIDVVKSDKFSAFRQQINITLNNQLISIDHEGQPNQVMVLS